MVLGCASKTTEDIGSFRSGLIPQLARAKHDLHEHRVESTRLLILGRQEENDVDRLDAEELHNVLRFCK